MYNYLDFSVGDADVDQGPSCDDDISDVFATSVMRSYATTTNMI